MVENFTILYDVHGSIITISCDQMGTLCLLENVAFIHCRDSILYDIFLWKSAAVTWMKNLVHLLLLERFNAKTLKELIFLNNEKEKYHGIVATED